MELNNSEIEEYIKNKIYLERDIKAFAIRHDMTLDDLINECTRMKQGVVYDYVDKAKA